MDVPFRFMIAALGALAALLAFDLAYVMSGQSRGPLRVPDGFLYAGAYAAFLWASWPMFPRSRANVRALLRAVSALIALVSWFPPAAIALINFHFAIGGTK